MGNAVWSDAALQPRWSSGTQPSVTHTGLHFFFFSPPTFFKHFISSIFSHIVLFFFRSHYYYFLVQVCSDNLHLQEARAPRCQTLGFLKTDSTPLQIKLWSNTPPIWGTWGTAIFIPRTKEMMQAASAARLWSSAHSWSSEAPRQSSKFRRIMETSRDCARGWKPHRQRVSVCLYSFFKKIIK